MNQISIIDVIAAECQVVEARSALAGLILAAISGALVTVAGSAVLVWLGWI